MLLYSFYQTNYTFHDIKHLMKIDEIAPANLCNISIESSAIS